MQKIAGSKSSDFNIDAVELITQTLNQLKKIVLRFALDVMIMKIGRFTNRVLALAIIV